MKSSLALAGAGAVVSSMPSSADEPGPGQRQFYELRLYHLKRGPQTDSFDKYYGEVAVPALNRAGLTPVGVFKAKEEAEELTRYVLLPHPSLESTATLYSRLEGDAEFQKAGAEFHNAPASNPSYIRMDSSLMKAFEGMPKLEAPAFPGGGASRVFQLRTYESHSRKAHLKKVEMFNRWEMSIFRRVGLTPVFFGQTIIGSRLPNLTYLLGFENSEAKDKGWSNFGADAEWKKLKATPGYTDPEIVSKINNLVLQPAACSQI